MKSIMSVAVAFVYVCLMIVMTGCSITPKRDCGAFPQLAVKLDDTYRPVDVCVDKRGEITWKISSRELPPTPKLQPAPLPAPNPAPLPALMKPADLENGPEK